MERAILGVDGDHAFALLGENIQEGECEFVKIKYEFGPGMYHSYYDEKNTAYEAYRRLKERLKDRVFSYALGPGLAC